MEIGEPVIGERHAGEVGDLRREVGAGVERLGDREVHAQVAPVGSARRHAIRRHAPDADCQRRADDQRRQGGKRQGARKVRRRPRRSRAGERGHRDRDGEHGGREEDGAPRVAAGHLGEPVDEVRRERDRADDRQTQPARAVDSRRQKAHGAPARHDEQHRPDGQRRQRRNEPRDEERSGDRGARHDGAAGRGPHRLRIIAAPP